MGQIVDQSGQVIDLILHRIRLCVPLGVGRRPLAPKSANHFVEPIERLGQKVRNSSWHARISASAFSASSRHTDELGDTADIVRIDQ